MSSLSTWGGLAATHRSRYGKCRHLAPKCSPGILGRTVRLPSVDMPAPVDPKAAAHERALQEVGETMLMIEAAVTRVDKALSALRLEAEPDRQALVGLTKAKRDLEGVRRRLHQDVYLYVDGLPLE